MAYGDIGARSWCVRQAADVGWKNSAWPMIDTDVWLTPSPVVRRVVRPSGTFLSMDV
jgi:hypothetical protein